MKRVYGLVFALLSLSLLTVSCDKDGRIDPADSASSHNDNVSKDTTLAMNLDMAFVEGECRYSPEGMSFYSAVCNECSWLNVANDGSGSLIISAERNEETVSRSADVDVVFSDGSSAVLTVRQNAYPVLKALDISHPKDSTEIYLELGEDTEDVRIWLMPVLGDLSPEEQELIMEFYSTYDTSILYDFMLSSDREDIYDYQEYLDMVEEHGRFCIEGIPMNGYPYEILIILTVDRYGNVGKDYRRSVV